MDMVYEKKCSECGKMIDYGGKETETLPENAMEFNGEIYCRECVKEFVEFGTGDILARIDEVEEKILEVREELGFKTSP